MAWLLSFFILVSQQVSAYTCNSHFGAYTTPKDITLSDLHKVLEPSATGLFRLTLGSRVYLVLPLKDFSPHSPEYQMASMFVQRNLIKAFERKLRLPVRFLDVIRHSNSLIFPRMTLILEMENNTPVGSIGLTRSGRDLGELPLQIEQRLMNLKVTNLEFEEGYEIGRLHANSVEQMKNLVLLANELAKEERARDIPIFFLTNEAHIRVYRGFGFELEKIKRVNINPSAPSFNQDYIVRVKLTSETYHGAPESPIRSEQTLEPAD